MSKRDYYEVLGLERSASPEDVKRAYKKIALKDHPDRNPGNAEAEVRFKEATEAYTVLSDEDKRKLYDQWGHDGPQRGGGNWGGDPFTNFQDIFSDIFGRRGGMPQQPQGPQRGDDIRVAQRITLKESMTGCSKELSLELPSNCDDCSGTGAKKGTSRKNCVGCNGTGQVMMRQGFMSIVHPCGACGGAGTTVEFPCHKCKGSGTVNKNRKINVSIPAGINMGQQLRVTGAGLPSRNGGVAGDAYVIIEVQPEDGWNRDGDDLITMQVLSFVTATLGGKINVELPDGEKIDVDVPPGVQPGTEILAKGKGMPVLRQKGNRGNLKILVNVKVPANINENAKNLLRELEKELTIS